MCGFPHLRARTTIAFASSIPDRGLNQPCRCVQSDSFSGFSEVSQLQMPEDRVQECLHAHHVFGISPRSISKRSRWSITSHCNRNFMPHAALERDSQKQLVRETSPANEIQHSIHTERGYREDQLLLSICLPETTFMHFSYTPVQVQSLRQPNHWCQSVVNIHSPDSGRQRCFDIDPNLSVPIGHHGKDVNAFDNVPHYIPREQGTFCVQSHSHSLPGAWIIVLM